MKLVVMISVPDGRPVIGQVPCSNVFVAAGHEGNGLALVPSYLLPRYMNAQIYSETNSNSDLG